MFFSDNNSHCSNDKLKYKEPHLCHTKFRYTDLIKSQFDHHQYSFHLWKEIKEIFGEKFP